MYNGDSQLRCIGENVEIDQHKMEEIIRCKEDIIYFAENYFHIITIDDGKIKIKLRDYQKKMLKAFIEPINGARNLAVCSCRQGGKTTIVSIYLSWFGLFSTKEMNIAILANKETTALEILNRLKLAYRELPFWMQQGISDEVGGWNKKMIGLGNGVRYIAGSTASSTIRGYTINLLYLDEFAFVPDNIADEFMTSVYPTIVSGKSSKIIITSTPNGLNAFYNIWKGAIRGENNYMPIKVSWQDIPGHDEEWKENIIRDIGTKKFAQEFGCLKRDSILSILDTNTKNITRLTIEDLYIEMGVEQDFIKLNKNFLIETPNGFEPFHGITKLPKVKTIKFKLEDNYEIDVSFNHKFYVDGDLIIANTLVEGELLETKEGLKKILEISVNEEDDIYEVLEIKNKEHTYYSNGVLNHNCDFLGSAQTLVDANILQRMNIREPVELKIGKYLNVYERPIEGVMYILGVDTAKGLGKDYSCIQVIKVNSEHDIDQVAVYRNNMIDPKDYSQVVISVSEYYNNAYIMLENNDVGNEVGEAIHYDFEYDYIINCDPKGIGIKSTKKTKLAGNLLMKRYIENGWLDIVDRTTLYELSRYEEISPNVFSSPRMGNDDTVSSLLWAIYFLSTAYFDGKNLNVKKIDDKFKVNYEDSAPIAMIGDEDEDGFFDNSDRESDGDDFDFIC